MISIITVSYIKSRSRSRSRSFVATHNYKWLANRCKTVMTLKPRKTAGNNAPVHSKTMGVSTANSSNNDNTTMTQLNTGKTCSKCGMGLEWFDVCKNGEIVGMGLECPTHGITR